MLLDTIHVPSEDIPALSRQYSNFAWHVQESILNESSQITLVASGESPRIKLDAFTDHEISHVVTSIRASRSTPAFWTLTALGKTASVHIATKEGSIIFGSQSELVGFNKFIRAARQFSESKFIQSTGVIVSNMHPELQKRIALQDDNGKVFVLAFFSEIVVYLYW